MPERCSKFDIRSHIGPHKLFCSVWQFGLQKNWVGLLLSPLCCILLCCGLITRNECLFKSCIIITHFLVPYSKFTFNRVVPCKGGQTLASKKEDFLYFCTKRSSQGYCNWMNTLDSPICKHGPSITDFFTSMTGQTNFFVDSFMIQRRGYI